MNHLLRTALGAFFVVSAVGALAQTKWETAMFYDFKSKGWAGIVTTPLATFRDVLGRKGLTLDLDAFAGVTFDGGSPVAGVSLGKRFPLADTVTGYVGLGIRAANREPVSAGPVFGLSVRF